MTAEYVLYKHLVYGKSTYIGNQNENVLKAMEEYASIKAKEHAGLAFDAAREVTDNTWTMSGVEYEIEDKEQYLKETFK